MPWQLKPDRPIYAQLIEEIELRICAGIYPPGSKLPSVRDLAEEAAVNPNTMQRALAKLEKDGLLYAQRTSGRYITEDVSMIKQVKMKLAKEHIDAFLEKMTSLGFEKDEILSNISIMLKEDEGQ